LHLRAKENLFPNLRRHVTGGEKSMPTTEASFFQEFAAKMRGAGLSEAPIRAFRHNYENLVAGQTGMIPEDTIEPVQTLPRLEDVATSASTPADQLAQTVILKLNGGLGTSMGLEKAKSLLVVRNGLNFLDFIVRQLLFLKEKSAVPVRFLVMNSFSTSQDTLEFLKKYAELGEPRSLELMQNQVPKVDAQTLRPVTWPQNPQLEWCPPGHGDIYPSLLGSGVLDRLVAAGARFLFVSNSDNLGATLDPGLLKYFAESKLSFLMEVALRTASDRKGGHLAKRERKLLLRESAQCPESHQEAFQDISRHRFFNTNNLWIRLDSLAEALASSGGFIPLPLIKNSKTVDPRDKTSTPVFQLETAMGAAIEYFENSGAIVVPRSRFAPVKTTSDLLVLRSDAYRVTEDWRLLLAEGQDGRAPRVDLDEHYRLVDQLDAMTAAGEPSLRECGELVVRGPVLFNEKNLFKGKVTITNSSPSARALSPGEYRDATVAL
jgi:UDP-N-acetylglucosamine pyrophosphorylase